MKYIMIWSFAFLLILNSCNYRTPSKTRFEKSTGLKLPNDFKVIKDDFQDSWQGYWLDYEIRFTNNSTKEFVDEIYSSSKISMWNKNDSGYSMRYEGKKEWFYLVELDTITNILKYTEAE